LESVSFSRFFESTKMEKAREKKKSAGDYFLAREII
jgi:hypothetical protein